MSANPVDLTKKKNNKKKKEAKPSHAATKGQQALLAVTVFKLMLFSILWSGQSSLDKGKLRKVLHCAKLIFLVNWLPVESLFSCVMFYFPLPVFVCFPAFLPVHLCYQCSIFLLCSCVPVLLPSLLSLPISLAAASSAQCYSLLNSSFTCDCLPPPHLHFTPRWISLCWFIYFSKKGNTSLYFFCSL